MAVEDIDLGWQDVLSEVNKLDRMNIKVGFPARGEVSTDFKRRKKSTATLLDSMGEMVTVAASQEFGTKNIPARPFMRPSYDQKKGEVNNKVQREYERVLDLKQSAKMAGDRVGLWFAGVIKKTITDVKKPALSTVTIKRKGSKNPLIDTGQMRASVQHVIE